jgi:hypothetical protein
MTDRILLCLEHLAFHDSARVTFLTDHNSSRVAVAATSGNALCVLAILPFI